MHKLEGGDLLQLHGPCCQVSRSPSRQNEDYVRQLLGLRSDRLTDVQLLEKVTPSQTQSKQVEQAEEGKKRKSAGESDDAGESKHGKTQHGIPDADALFGDWSGANKPTLGLKEPDMQDKEDKLL